MCKWIGEVVSVSVGFCSGCEWLTDVVCVRGGYKWLGDIVCVSGWVRYWV